MLELYSSKIINILSVGTCLDKEGINNWALTKEQALEAVKEFKAIDIAILGGDVMYLENDRIRHTYDNWFTETSEKEIPKEFNIRSYQIAQNYIENYENNKYSEIFYLLVPDNSELQ